jgi:hypothetical protein
VNRRDAKREGGVRGLCRARNTQILTLDSEKSFVVVSIMRLCSTQKSTVVFHCLDRVWTSPAFPMARLSLGSARGARLECSLSQSSLVTNEREGMLARLYNTRPKSLGTRKILLCTHFSRPITASGPQSVEQKLSRESKARQALAPR